MYSSDKFAFFCVIVILNSPRVIIESPFRQYSQHGLIVVERPVYSRDKCDLFTNHRTPHFLLKLITEQMSLEKSLDRPKEHAFSSLRRIFSQYCCSALEEL